LISIALNPIGGVGSSFADAGDDRRVYHGGAHATETLTIGRVKILLGNPFILHPLGLESRRYGES
jgi:hypothetical protein